jgi:hypothetical protein
MKNFIYYIKDWRTIVGLLFIISTFGMSSEGKVFRSKWDDSVQYQKPVSGGMKAGIIVVGVVFILAGIGKKQQQLNQNAPEENNEKNS